MDRSFRMQALSGAGLLLAGAACILAGWRFTPPGEATPVPTPVAGLIRLHIIAHSDAPAEQALKQQVRAAVLPAIVAAAGGAPDAATVTRRLAAGLPGLRALVGTAMAGRHPVRVELGPADFDGRQYGTLYLPPGRYQALRIIIGDGAGHNWWCVLFPVTCFQEWYSRVEVAGAPVSAEDRALAQQLLLLDERQAAEVEVVADSALLRWLRRMGWRR